MASLNLKLLMGRLNDASRRSLEAAAGMSLSHSNYNVELEHWLLKLVESSRTDVELLLRFYGVNTANLSRDLLRVVDRLKTGNSRSPALAEDILNLVREAWLIASVDYKASSVRTGHLLCALLADDSLARLALAASSEFEKISVERCARLVEITGNSSEATAAAESAPADGGGASRPVAPGSKTPSA